MTDPLDLAAAARPDQIVAAIAARTADRDESAALAHGLPHGIASVRTASHNGHEIVIRTSYEIEVDGQPFQPHIVVDNGGRVHYHGLPTRDFASLVDLVKKAIDTFPGDFAEPGTTQPDPSPSPGHGPGHDTGHGSAHGAGHGH